MNLPLGKVAALLIVLSALTLVVSGQQSICSCESPDSTCKGRVSCANGCTALCGSKDACYLSCRRDLLVSRFTVKFNKKQGEDIAALLSERTKTKIQYVPYSRNVGKLYDLAIENDDIWNVLYFLNKRGNVKVGGLKFEEFKTTRKDMKSGGRFSLKLNQIPVEDAVARLAFLSGRRLVVKSGDSEKLVSVSLENVTLREIVARLSSVAGVQIEDRSKKSSQR